MRVPQQQGFTNEQGQLTFVDLPVGVYLIDVSFSQDFCSCQKRYQVVIEANKKNDYKVFVGLQPRNEIYVQFKFQSGEEIIRENMESRLTMIPERVGASVGQLNKKDSEQEFEVLYD